MLKLSLIALSLSFASLLVLGASPRGVAAKSCGDFASQAEAQAYLKANPTDPDGLDPAHAGIACKDLPCPCDRIPFHGTVATPLPSPTATATPVATATVPATPTQVTSTTQQEAPVVQAAPGGGQPSAPPPQAPLGLIRPPSTGSAGLR